MKKQFLFGMAAVAALCSCSNNEVMEAPESLQTPITFGTYVGNSVNGRAAVTDIDALKNGTNANENGSVTNITSGFGVFAYYTAQKTWNDVAASATPNFMYNQKVQWDGTTNATAPTTTPAWKYSPLKYWPNNDGDKISFYAYAPFTAVTNVATGTTGNIDQNITEFTENSAEGAPTVTYFVKPEAIKAQQDLVYAESSASGDNPNQDLSKQTNVDNAAITTKQKVTFNFVHALARIGFNVETLIDEENSAGTGTTENNTTTGKDYEVDGSSNPLTIVKVTEVQLKGKFYQSGVLDLVNGTWGSTTTPVSESTFTLSYQTEDNTADVSDILDSNFDNNVAEKVTTGKQQLNAKDSYIMVIPQQFATENGLTIVVKYDVYTKDSNLKANGSTVVEEDVDGSGTAAIWSKISNEITSSPFAIDLAKGKAYMFNLHLGLTSVKFDASVTGWGTNNEKVVNVPLNTATGAGA